MTRIATHLRTVLAAAVMGAALLAVPEVADAAKVRIGGTVIPVNDDGVATVKLTNPNRGAAKGTLALKSSGTPIGSRGFRIGARRSSKVKLALSVDALQVLAQGYDLRATAYAKAKGRGTSRKTLVLTYPGAASGGGGDTGGGSPPSGQQPAAPAWADGRWQGTYATSNADLAFNVTGTRLYTGPFDKFYIEPTCQNNGTDAIAMEPIEATIGPDGNFSGSGTYRPSASTSIPWTLTGHIAGKSLTGTLSVSYTDAFNGACSGTTTFTASWYGDYTL